MLTSVNTGADSVAWGSEAQPTGNVVLPKTVILLNKASTSEIRIIRSGFEEVIKIKPGEEGWLVVAVSQGDRIFGQAEFYKCEC